MKTLLEVLNLSADYLKERQIESPLREAQDLICDALNIKRVQLYLEYDRPMTDSELKLLRERLARRGKGEPSAYIHGYVSFLDCSLKVTSDVLIPRQETEILADKITKSLASEDLTGKTLWDICCGSGCLGIAIKKKLPGLHVVMSDISSSALTIAKENAALNNVEIECRKGDLFTPFNQDKTDYLVCNPPYISQLELTTLSREVRDWEPHQALLGGDSGLDFYYKLAECLPHFLNPKGKAWFEIGATQGPALISLFQGKPWKTSRLESDWSGKDRFFFLEIE